MGVGNYNSPVEVQQSCLTTELFLQALRIEFNAVKTVFCIPEDMSVNSMLPFTPIYKSPCKLVKLLKL